MTPKAKGPQLALRALFNCPTEKQKDFSMLNVVPGASPRKAEYVTRCGTSVSTTLERQLVPVRVANILIRLTEKTCTGLVEGLRPQVGGSK